MMNKILLLTLLVTPTLWAQDTSEEAIILNQELQFLEDSANNVTIQGRADRTLQERALPIETQSLEEKYFGSGADSIQTRTAAPKRKRSAEE